jgi:hypothetical protein
MTLFSKLRYCTSQHILILFKHLLALQVAVNTGGSQGRMNMCIKYPTYKHYYCCNLLMNKSVSERVRHCSNNWITPLRFFSSLFLHYGSIYSGNHKSYGLLSFLNQRTHYIYQYTPKMI